MTKERLQFTEYVVRPMDEYRDIIDNFFEDTEKKARVWIKDAKEVHPEATEWVLEKVWTKFRDDGEFLDQKITEIDEGDY